MLRRLSVLEKPINRLITRVRFEQDRNSGPLLQCIDLLIAKHEDFLIDKFNISLNHYNKYDLKQQIWNGLKHTKNDHDLMKRKDMMRNNNSQLYTPEYNQFIKKLYPLESQECLSFTTNDEKYENVNYFELFNAFCKLPHPASSYLPFETFNEFTRKYFQGFNKIKIDKLNNTHGSMISKLNQRTEFFKSCIRIVEDLKSSNLPITQQEQLKLIYMTYFKDRQDITIKHPGIKYPTFDWDHYQKLVKNDRNDMFGLLLFLATRHDKFDIIKDILNRVNLNILNGNSKALSLTDMSINHLIYYFTFYIDRPGYNQYLANTIEYVTNHLILTNQIIDTLIKALLDLRLFNHAELLFQNAFVKDYTVDESKYVNIYKKLKILTKDKEIVFKLSPTIQTFENFFEAYIADFDKINQMLHIAKMLKFPISVKIYTMIFDSFNRNNWPLSDLIYMLDELIKDMDESDTHPLVYRAVSNLLVSNVFSAFLGKIEDKEQLKLLKELHSKWDQTSKETEKDELNIVNKRILNEISLMI